MSGKALHLAIVGYGKIAQDQHVPSIAANADLDLVACVSRRGVAPDGVVAFKSITELRESGIPIDAVALCNTPEERLATALESIAAGWHVLIEKPAAATLGAADAIMQAASAAGVTLFAAWHSRFASGVEPARRALAGRRVDRIEIQWREDVRKWHPDQDWIWMPGGFGVFDPGVNALSIATHILPCELNLATAGLQVPANRQMPIAGELTFAGVGVPAQATASFDWRESEGEQWTISIEHDGGSLTLLDGGDRLLIDGRPAPTGQEGEYPALYRQFVNLLRCGASDVDLRPMRLVADAFMIGTRQLVDAFED